MRDRMLKGCSLNERLKTDHMKQLAVILLFMACFVESRASGALADDSLYCFRFVRGKVCSTYPTRGTGKRWSALWS